MKELRITAQLKQDYFHVSEEPYRNIKDIYFEISYEC